MTRSLTWCLTRCLTLFIAIYHLSHLLHIVYSSIYVIRGKTVSILSLCHLLHIVIVYMCNTWQITCLYSDFLSYFNALGYFTGFVCRLFHGLPLIAYKRYYIYAKSGKTTSILSPYYFIYIFMFIDTLPLIAYSNSIYVQYVARVCSALLYTHFYIHSYFIHFYMHIYFATYCI